MIRDIVLHLLAARGRAAGTSVRHAQRAAAFGLLLLAGAVACSRGQPQAGAAADSAATAPATAAGTAPIAEPPAGGAVDSVIPRDTLLARFRKGTTEVTAFSGGATSRDALVAAWARAMRTGDLAAFPTLALTKDEFAWLYYPTNPQGLPPYDLAPALMWFMLEGQSRKGLGRALEERGGPSFRYVDYRCTADSSQQGENTVWGPCEIRRLQAAGDTVTERLFGLIVRRGGVYKFVGYQNRL